MRLGIFGGSFDPVHYGHLLLAETCREARHLDEVWLVPNFQPPHKPDRVLTPVRNRLEMLDLALAGNEGLRVSSLEAERGGLSYTVDTLARIRQEQPATELFFLLGADALRDLPTWRDPGRICDLAAPLVVARWGAPVPDLSSLQGLLSEDRISAVRAGVVEMPFMEISSTDLRQRVQEGRSIRFRTPRAVETYIATHGLYRDLARSSP